MRKKLLGIILGLAIALAAVVVPAVNAEELDLSSMDNAQLIALIQQLISGSTSTPADTTTPATTSFDGIPSGFTFDSNLSEGMSGDSVKYLQIVLNSDSATAVATSGTGSAGNESTYFGSLTKSAVIKFQNKYASEVLTPLGLTSGTGYVGASTRVKLNEILASGSSTSTPTDVSSLSAVECVTQGYAWNGTVCSDPNAGVVDVSSLSAVECVTQGYAWNGTSCYDASGSTPSTPTVTPVTGAGMTVSLASNSPSGTTLVTGQSAAPLARFVLTNKDSVAASITNVTLNRIGVSADATLSNVYLFDGDIRLTDSASVNQGVISFNNGAGLFSIPAGNSMIVTVAADIATGSTVSGQIVGVSLTGLTSNVEVSSTLPIQGGTQTIAYADLAAYTFGTMNSGASVDPADDIVVWQTTVTSSNRDIEISKLALKQISSIDRDDVQNFRLFINGEEVAQVDGLDTNNMVTFLFDYTLSGSKTFKVVADIIGGSSRTLQMSLRNAADFTAIDSQYGVAVARGSTGTAIPASGGALNILEGSATMKKDSTSPTGYASLNASNQLLAKYDLEVYGEDIKIDTLTFKAIVADAGAGDANLPSALRNGRVLINGTQYGSTTALNNSSSGTAFTVNYVAQPGETITIEVYADIYADSSSTYPVESGDTITVSAVGPGSGSQNATRQVSLTTLYVPAMSSTVSANPLTVSSGSLSAAVQSNYGNQSVVFPQSDYKIGSYVITGDSVEAVNVYNLALATTVSDSAANTQVRNVYAVIDGVTDSAIKTNATVNGTVTTYNFSVNKALAKNGTMNIEFFADIDTIGDPNSSAYVQTTLVASATGDESGQSIYSDGGTPQTGQRVSFSAASITITRGASSPDAAILPDEGTVKTISYQIETQNDAYLIDTVAVSFAEANAGTVISQVKLMDGSTTLQTRAVEGTSATFAGLNYTVPANAKKTLDIVVILSSVGPGAGTSGADIKTTFSSSRIAPVSTGVIGAYGGSGSYAGTTPSAGNDLYVYKTIPTVSLVTLPSSTLTAGTKTLSKFSISANESSAISWKKLAFTVNVSANPTIANCDASGCTGIKLYDGSTLVEGTMTSSAALSTAGAKTAVITFVPTAEQEISAEATKTYELKATTVGGSIASTDYIITSINNPSTGVIGAAVYTKGGSNTTAYVEAGDTRTADTVYSHTAAITTADAGDSPTATLTGFTNDDATVTFTYGSGTTVTASVSTWTISANTAAGFTAVNYATGAKVVVASGVFTADDTVVVTKTGSFLTTTVGGTDSDVGALILGGNPVGTASFVWSDESAQSHTIFTHDWANDYLVKNLPTDSQSLTRS